MTAGLKVKRSRSRRSHTQRMPSPRSPFNPHLYITFNPLVRNVMPADYFEWCRYWLVINSKLFCAFLRWINVSLLQIFLNSALPEYAESHCCLTCVQLVYRVLCSALVSCGPRFVNILVLRASTLYVPLYFLLENTSYLHISVATEWVTYSKYIRRLTRFSSCLLIWLHPPAPFPSSCIGRLYLLHKERRKTQREVRKVLVVYSWGGCPQIIWLQKRWASLNYSL